jgi:hypothetical protein
MKSEVKAGRVFASQTSVYAEFVIPVEGGSAEGRISVNIRGYDPDEITYYYETSIYLNRKKIRVQRGRHNTTENPKDLANPAFLFPAKRVVAIIKRAQPGGAMGRKDFVASLERELDATIKYSGNDLWAYVPLGEDRKLVMFRSVIRRSAAWIVNGIYEGNRRVEQPRSKIFPESDQGLNDIKKFVRSL